MSEIKNILNSKLSIQNETLNETQRFACYNAMLEFSAYQINEYKQNENKSVVLEAIKLFPALFVGEWKLWLRKRSFLKAKKAAQIQADIEGRPFYVIRSTQIAYVIQSTKKVRELKRRRFYRKNVTAMKMQEVADYTAIPKGKSL